MPQASPRLRRKFKNGTDSKAWNVLKKRGFTEERFLIHIPHGRKLTRREANAIEYLITEWDWDAERDGKSIWW